MPLKRKVSKLASPFPPLRIFLLVILAVVVLLGRQHAQTTDTVSKADNEHLNSNYLCTDFDKTITEIKNTSLKPYIFDENERKDGNMSAMSVSWKRNPEEPDVTYNSERSFELYVNSKTVDEVRDILTKELTPYFESKGFELSDLNTGSTKIDYLQYSDFSEVGYVKQNLLYTINMDTSLYKVVKNKQVDLPENTTGIYVQCASIEPELDQLYTDLLKDRAWMKGPDKVDSISIWKNQNGLVLAQTGNGGSYITKNNGEWELLYRGQDYPMCDLLESRKVGKGFSCNRKILGNDEYKSSTVDY